MPQPVFLNVRDATTGLLGPVAWSFAPDQISFTINAFGGDESAEAGGTMDARLAQLWLQQLQAQGFVVDRHAQTVWTGLLARVAVDDGRSRTVQTIDGLVNSVYVTYTVKGGQRFTAVAQNTASIARYGEHFAILSGGEATATAAAAMRDRYLVERAWPRREVGASLASGLPRGAAEVTLSFVGYATNGGPIDWLVGRTLGAQSSSIGGLQNLVIALFASSDSPGNNFVIDYAGGGITYSRPTVLTQTLDMISGIGLAVPVTNGYENLGDKLRALLALGDTTGQRVAWGVKYQRRNGVPGTFYANVWAANTPTTIGYYVAPPVAVYTGGMAPVAMARVRPDAMVQHISRPIAQTIPTTAVDAGNRFYCARTSYSWQRGRGEKLTMEGLGGGGVAAMIAQVGR